MNTTPIRTKADHKAALKAIESLMSAKANTPEGERLDVLVTLVEAYERGMPAESLLQQSTGKAS
jgi:HTH-type transcriptional regulator/antitoxin HigA